MQKPNFLFIYPDTLGARAVGCYGNPVVKTPNIDALAASGVRFGNCTSANPVCCPSRMSLHTGKYVSAHGLIDNGLGDYLPEHLTIARYLRERGYKTAYYGKTHAVDQSEWDDVFDLYPHYNHYLAARDIDTVYPEQPPISELGHGVSKIPSEHWATNVLGNLGAGFIAKQKRASDPFMLFVSFEAPHGPVTLPFDEPNPYDPADIELPATPEGALDPKPATRKAYMKARASVAKNDDVLKRALTYYYAMVSLMDSNAGKLMDALEASGLRENTIVIFLSDHGDFMGNYGCVGKGMSLDQSLIHVPLIVNSPKKFAPRVVDGLVESIDIFPTISDLLHEPPPKGLQGATLLSLIQGKTHEAKPYAFSEEFYGEGPYFFAVRNRNFKLVLSSTGEQELYNINADPWEWHDLSRDPNHREVLQELKEAVIAWRFRCVDRTRTRKDNYIQRLLRGEMDQVPAYLGGRLPPKSGT